MRTFTRALRVPALVGKMPGGGSWPGGPYTITQVVGAALVVIGGLHTIEFWGRFGWLLDRVALLAAAAAVGVALQVVKPGGRDPLSAGIAIFGLYGNRRWGRHHGHGIRLRRPHRARHRLLIELPAELAAPIGTSVATDPPPATASPSTPPSLPKPARRPQLHQPPAEGRGRPAPMHGVAALLAAATAAPPASGPHRYDAAGIPAPRHSRDGGRR